MLFLKQEMRPNRMGPDEVPRERSVVRGESEANELHRVQPFGPRQDTEDGLPDVGTRGEQQAALDGAAGHFDERPAFWDMTELSHAHRRRKMPEKSLNFSESASVYACSGCSQVRCPERERRLEAGAAVVTLTPEAMLRRRPVSREKAANSAAVGQAGLGDGGLPPRSEPSGGRFDLIADLQPLAALDDGGDRKALVHDGHRQGADRLRVAPQRQMGLRIDQDRALRQGRQLHAHLDALVAAGIDIHLVTL